MSISCRYKIVPEFLKTAGALTIMAMSVSAGCVPAKAASAVASGVNLSGLEFNAGTLPGRPNWDYGVPSDAELAYFQSKGINLIRLPVLWERLQPGQLGSNASMPLDPTYLSLITTILAQASARGMSVVVDLHDYGGYGGHKLGDGTLPVNALRHVWRRLALALRGTAGLGGYDLMNEPSNMPSPSIWPQAAQEAVNAIRLSDMTTTIFVEGDNWSSAGTWVQYNNNLHIHDAASRLVYEAHVYGDHDNSGTHFVWSQEAALGVTVNTIAQRIAPFAGWCSTNHATCMIGEIGVGNDDPNWNVQLANGLAELKQGGLSGFTYWAGGPWWGSYPLSIEPQNGKDALQMAVVSQY